jgi:phage-related protein
MKPSSARVLVGALAALLLMAAPIRVQAHHSSAMFDQSRSLTMHGVVKEFHWSNPHASIQLLAVGAGGHEEEWSIEMNSPERLAQDGWTSDTLRAGDAVSLVIHPMRNEAKGGQYLSGDGPRGPLIVESSPAPVLALTLPSAIETGSCPRVELTRIEPTASSETRLVRLGQQTVSVRRDAITTTSDISEIKVAGDDADTRVSIKYKAPGAARLLDATTDHDGVKLAFVVDDDVWLAFTWKGPYGIGPDGTQLSIQHGLSRAEKLMESIRSCTDTRAR